MSKMLRPFFSYYGGKWRGAPHYPEPRHGIILEPFAGSAGYSMRYPDRQIGLIEKDPIVAATWRYLIGVSESEIRCLPDLLPGQDVRDLRLTQEAEWLIGWWLNKGAASPCRTGSKWMRGGTHVNSFWGGVIRERIASQLEAIRHWKVLEGDYSQAPDIRATWFIDPPYEQKGEFYRMGSQSIDFQALGEWCRARRGQVLVCENEGASWLPFQRFRSLKSSPGRGGYSHEVLWEKAE